MEKVSEEVLLEYVTSVGKFEKLHYKYASFYCTMRHVITQADVDWFAEMLSLDASDFLSVEVVREGIWDETYGVEWDHVVYSKEVAHQEFVPERIIPEHYITVYEYVKFEPKWE